MVVLVIDIIFFLYLHSTITNTHKNNNNFFLNDQYRLRRTILLTRSKLANWTSHYILPHSYTRYKEIHIRIMVLCIGITHEMLLDV